MNISLTPELEQWIQNKVNSGLYHSASEVIREALRILREQDILKEYRLDQIRKEIQIGLNELELGQGIPLEEIIEEIKARRNR